MNYRRHEIMMKSVEIATESETGWLIRIGLRDNDLIVWRTAPVNSAGIDHHREFVRPRPRQRAPKYLLPNRSNRHIDTRQLADSPRISARRYNNPPRWNAARLVGIDAFLFDLSDFVGYVNGAQFFRSSPKSTERGAWFDVPVLWSEQSSNQIVRAEFGN